MHLDPLNKYVIGKRKVGEGSLREVEGHTLDVIAVQVDT